MEIRGLPAVTRYMRCRERELLPKAIGLRSDKVSIVSDPRILDHMLCIPWSSWPFSGEANGQLSWRQRALNRGRWTWEKMATDQRDGLGGALMPEEKISFNPELLSFQEDWGHGMWLPRRVCTVPQQEIWNIDLGIYVLQLFFWKREVGQGEGGRKREKKETGEKKNHKKRKTKITSFVYAERRGIWLTKRGWIIKIIIDMKVHWKLLFFFSRMER